MTPTHADLKHKLVDAILLSGCCISRRDSAHAGLHHLAPQFFERGERSIFTKTQCWKGTHLRVRIALHRKAQSTKKKLGVRASLARKLLSKRAVMSAAHDMSTHEAEAHQDLNTNRWEEK